MTINGSKFSPLFAHSPVENNAKLINVPTFNKLLDRWGYGGGGRGGRENTFSGQHKRFDNNRSNGYGNYS